MDPFDRIGLQWTEVYQIDRKDRIRINGPKWAKWTEWTKVVVDQNELNGQKWTKGMKQTEVEQMNEVDRIGPNQTEVQRMVQVDQSGPNVLKQTKMEREWGSNPETHHNLHLKAMIMSQQIKLYLVVQKPCQ